MDRLPENVIQALEQVYMAAEKTPVGITQDVDNEILVIKTMYHAHRMNCAMNSVSATVRQFCKELYTGALK